MSPARPPLWILAAPFCGASWLAACLDSHPDLLALPQLDLWMAPDVGGLLDIYDLGQGTHGHGLLRAVAMLRECEQTEHSVLAARAWLDTQRHCSVDGLLEQLIALAQPRRLVIPDAESPLRPIDLARLQHAETGLMVIHLTRHPWEQGCLLHSWARQRIHVPPDFKDHAHTPAQIEPQFPWVRANRNILALKRRLSPGQVLQLHSEDVENAASTSLRAITDWLGVPWPEVFESGGAPDRWCFAQPGPANASGGVEVELSEPFPEPVLALAAATRLRDPLPWHDDRSGFHPELLKLAAELGYGNS